MRILFLFSQPWRFGGAETYTTALIKGLAGRGHEITLITDSGSEPDIPEGVSNYYKLPFRSSGLIGYIQLFRKLRGIIIKHEIQLLHAQQRTAGYLAALINKQLQIPYIITMHDIWHRAPFKKIHGRIFGNAIAVSEYIREYFIAKFSLEPDNMCTIHNGIDDSIYVNQSYMKEQAASNREQFQIGEMKVITIVGRIVRAKGHFDLIKAAALLVEQGLTNFKVLVVGEGPDLQEIKHYVEKLGLTGQVIFTGYRKDIPAIMSASDVVVLPSYREGFPLTILEAMFARKPVIASRVGGIPEAVLDGKTGYLFEDNSPEELAKKLQIIITQDEVAAGLGDAGFERANNLFTLSKMIDKTELFYQKVVEEIRSN